MVGALGKLGIKAAKSTVEEYMMRPKKPSSATWKVFLENHMMHLVCIDAN